MPGPGDNAVVTRGAEPAAHARPLGVWSLLTLGINGIVGIGIFFTPQKLAGLAPGWTSIAVLAATGLGLFPVALAVSTVGARFDEDGGPVVYAREAFGQTAGFLVGWLAYTAALFSMSTVMTGFMGAVLPARVGAVGVHVAAVALLTILTLVAATGVEISAWIWSTLTVLKLLPLVALAVAATVLVSADGHQPLEPTGSVHWARAALTATFVFQGFEIVPVVAGQAKGGERTIPVAVLGSLTFSTLLYLVLQHGAVTGVHDLADQHAPLVAMGSAYAGKLGHVVVSIGISLSALGIAFGMVATTPRFLSALAPQSRFARQSKGGVPLLALAVTWAAATALVSMGSLGELLVLSSISVVIQYLIVALSLAYFAFKRQRGLRPSQSWSAFPTVLVALVLLSGAEAKEWIVAAGAMTVGVIVYLFSRRRF